MNGKPLLEVSNDRIIRTFEVNTLANFWTTRGTAAAGRTAASTLPAAKLGIPHASGVPPARLTSVPARDAQAPGRPHCHGGVGRGPAGRAGPGGLLLQQGPQPSCTTRWRWNRGSRRRVRWPGGGAPAQFGAVGFHEALRAELHRLNATCTCAEPAFARCVPRVRLTQGRRAHLACASATAVVKTTVICPSHVDTQLFKGFKPAAFTQTLTPQYTAQRVRAASRALRTLRMRQLMPAAPLPDDAAADRPRPPNRRAHGRPARARVRVPLVERYARRAGIHGATERPVLLRLTEPRCPSTLRWCAPAASGPAGAAPRARRPPRGHQPRHGQLCGPEQVNAPLYSEAILFCVRACVGVRFRGTS